MSDFDFPVVSENGIVRIDLGRPDEGNRLTRAMMLRLADLIVEAGSDEANHVVVIEARGNVFCSGRDGKGEVSQGVSAYDMRHKMMGATLSVYDAMAAVPVPVVARVHASAIGFGAALAAGCDITFASEGAKFSLPEIEHDIPPVLAMAALFRKVPEKALAYLVYSGQAINALQAITFGLASCTAPDASFQDEFEQFLAKLASRPRIVLETIKKYQKITADTDARTASEYAGTLLALVRSKQLQESSHASR